MSSKGQTNITSEHTAEMAGAGLGSFSSSTTRKTVGSHRPEVETPILYIPIQSPPTPAPSPSPTQSPQLAPQSGARLHPTMSVLDRIISLLLHLSVSDIHTLQEHISSRLKMDLLSSLPMELAFSVLGWINEPRTLLRTSLVCRRWHELCIDESLWRNMCRYWQFERSVEGPVRELSGIPRRLDKGKGKAGMTDKANSFVGVDRSLIVADQPSINLQKTNEDASQSSDRVVTQGYFRDFFRKSYETLIAWRTGGKLLHSHSTSASLSTLVEDPGGSGDFPQRAGPSTSQPRRVTRRSISSQSHSSPNAHRTQSTYLSTSNANDRPVAVNDHFSLTVVTSMALSDNWLVVSLSNSRIYVYRAETGVLTRTLSGHESGVWSVILVEKGGYYSGEVLGETSRTVPCPPLDPHIPKRSSEVPSGSALQTTSCLSAMSNPRDRRSVSSQSLPSKHLVNPLLDDSELLSKATSPLDMYGVDDRACHSTRSYRGTSESKDSDTQSFPEKLGDPCGVSDGWGQASALIVSGSCDRTIKVWDVESGQCLHTLRGHTSTIRCLKVVHNAPLAVSGSRDTTVRVWDIHRGNLLRVLEGHNQSVRCIDVVGKIVVSGSYDTTCRVWNVDTGECLRVLHGHFHQIYTIAFDGSRVVSGGVDTTIRIWDIKSGHCIALLQGHTALVCQLQFYPATNSLGTGASDGRVIIYDLDSYLPIQRISAHDLSISSLQFDRRFVVTGGTDGRARLFETETGNYIRELTDPAESIFKVVYKGSVCAVACRRNRKSMVEIWKMSP